MIKFFRQSKKEVGFIVIAWLCIHAFLFYRYGIGLQLEAEKYTGAARFFLEQGKFPEKKYLFYALTPLLIVFSTKLGLGYAGAVVIQSLISLCSILVFFRLCFSLSGNKRSAVLTTLILLIFLPYQSWNTYLYTESLFLSSVIFFVYAVFRISRGKNNHLKDYLLLIAATALVITSRPFGMLFLPALVLFLLVRLPKKLFIVSILIAVVTGSMMYYFLNRAFSGSVDWNSMVSNINGNIICDMPDSRYIEKLDLAEKGDPVAQLFYYVTHNTRHFLSLSAARLGAFFNLTRSYYSNAHNAMLIGFMILIYGWMITGLRNFTAKAPRSFVVFIYAGIIVYALSITLQCDDYHSRFIMAIIPFFLAVGSFGPGAIKNFFQRRMGSK